MAGLSLFYGCLYAHSSSEWLSRPKYTLQSGAEITGSYGLHISSHQFY